MPYETFANKERVKGNIHSVCTPSELNYLITLTLLSVFRGHMRYETIHEIKKDFVIEPKHNPVLRQLVSQLAGNFTTADVYAAASCAYDEFSRRIVAAYEEKKMFLNGDLEEYQEVLNLIAELGKPVEVAK